MCTVQFLVRGQIAEPGRACPILGVELHLDVGGSDGVGGFFRSMFSRKPSLAKLPSAATCFNMLKLLQCDDA